MSAGYSLEILRHSTSHVLAQAVLNIFSDAKLGIGPSIEEGFYYDFDLIKSLTAKDLEQIELEMQKIIQANQIFEKIILSKEKALALLQKQNQPYKIELLEKLDSHEYSFYQTGVFIDLCKGPHIENTNEIKAFKLLKISGAYWQGSEQNKMLQRIYGTAFFDKSNLDEYLNKQEEIKKRDHRNIGKDLFSIQDEIGAGLVIWHPKGARLRSVIEDLWKKEHIREGYELIYTPHIGKSTLWQTSGHLDFYSENMYSPIDIDNQAYYLKPMNCPFHISYYKTKQHSYRELPIRLAELGTVYRFERSGVLHGLMRVRGFTQDDAHIFCRFDQLDAEIDNALSFSIKMLKIFGFDKFKVFLSTRPTEFVGELSDWEQAQNALKRSITLNNLTYELDEGGGAFYGPKIDIKIEDAIGRAWQCSTIQVDFNLPARFNMSYIAVNSSKERPYMIHRALLGSLERFFGILIEHYEGKFPFWLAPVQIKILTINEDVIDYAKKVLTNLCINEIRAEIDISPDKINYKIRSGILEKVPYLFIIGKKEVETNTISVRSRDNGDLGTMHLDKFLGILKGQSPF